MKSSHQSEEETPHWTGPQWGAYYASIALSLGEVGEAADILNAILCGKWDEHSEET